MIQQARDGRVYSMPLAMYVHTCHRCGTRLGSAGGRADA